MIVVLFEDVIKPEYKDEYLRLASSLKPELEKANGFISGERFTSLGEEGKLLSMSLWKDEDSVSEWRNNMQHRMSQKVGKETMFDRFKITVCNTVRTYTMDEREKAPMDSKEFFKEV